VSFESSFFLTSLRRVRGIEKGRRAERRVFFSTASKPTTLREQEQDQVVTGEENGNMASDEDYSAFLDKANQDPNEGAAKMQSKGKVELKAVDQGVKVPAGLKKATSNAFYVSDADEPFEPVYLKFEGKKLPDEGEFLRHFYVKTYANEGTL
jgi:hypothetical protein